MKVGRRRSPHWFEKTPANILRIYTEVLREVNKGVCVATALSRHNLVYSHHWLMIRRIAETLIIAPEVFHFDPNVSYKELSDRCKEILRSRAGECVAARAAKKIM